MSGFETQAPRVALACAIALSLVPLRTALWRSVGTEAEVTREAVVLTLNAEGRETGDRICSWRR